MQLIDCFIETIAYVSLLLETVATQQPDFDRVNSDISELITAAEACRQQGRLSPEDFDLARFAVFAWIDEAILNSSWQEKTRWQGEQLQRRYYRTADAGEEFFEKLNNLGARREQVREIYYLCLALGFTGRYCNPGDEFLLEQLKGSNLKLLTPGSPDLSSLEQEMLFADGYPAADSQSMIPGTAKKRFPVEIVAGIVLPVLLFGALFLVYRFVLGNVGQNFISAVP